MIAAYDSGQIGLPIATAKQGFRDLWDLLGSNEFFSRVIARPFRESMALRFEHLLELLQIENVIESEAHVLRPDQLDGVIDMANDGFGRDIVVPQKDSHAVDAHHSARSCA